MMPLSGSESHAPRIVNDSDWFVSKSVAWTIVPMLTASVLALEKSMPRAHHLRFEFFLLAHDDFLRLFRGLVFMVFAQVAIAAGDGDLLGVRGDLLLHEFLVFEPAAFQAFPRDLNGAVLLGLFAADERLHGGMFFDEPREQRPLVHVVEHRRELQRTC